MAPPSTPDKFPSEDMFDILIRIDVGKDGEESEMRSFQVLKGVLCFYSGFFNAALKNDHYKETQNGHVRLPSEDPQIFELFVTWVHTRRFYDSTLAPSTLMPFDMIAGLCIFADAHNVPLLQNVACDVMMEKIKATRTFPSIDDIFYICDNTVDSSPLRQLLSDVVLAVSGGEFVWPDLQTRDEVEETHEHMTGSTGKWKYSQLKSWVNSCKYHTHEYGMSCST